ncbi:hypothetical protein BK133_22220 [Paenibacillus sp. FSL H8-0548]|uniref:hypothetical protein n=1 Tax=Paenibacillus sp. FSL H8-0548 TaxID=1920422 RepID=UPI00096FB1B8|nr:hypothetical protein [Paenibacillus sp. FSL H8-0548]OMF24813.1 hypothetical protein BK133_22220 [Paenibacillus sp. FSL H8-0548]
MTSEPKAHAPFIKYILIFVVLALLASLTFIWLRSGAKAAPPITEHTFELGQAVWEIDAYPAKVLQENHFEVGLTDLTGAPLQGAILSVKLEMLNMVCGDYEFQMTEVLPGKYSGEGIPLMAGKWKATITLEKAEHSYTLVRVLQAIH